MLEPIVAVSGAAQKPRVTIGGRPFVTWLEACRVTARWAGCNSHALHGDAFWRDADASAIARVAVRALARFAAAGSIEARVKSGTTPRRLNASTVASLEKLARGVSERGEPPLAEVYVDLGALRSRLLLEAGAFMIIVNSVNAPLVRALQTPCEVVTLLACGRALTPSEVKNLIFLDTCRYWWLKDHESGVVPLFPEAAARGVDLLDEFELFDEAFKRETALLERKIVGGAVQAYSADTGLALTVASFALPMMLDPLQEMFIPALNLSPDAPDWQRASARCKDIGAVLLAPEARGAKRKTITKPAMRRAEERLCTQCEAWLRDERPMPKKEAWLAEGAEIAGSKHAAAKVWAKVVSDPRFAALRKAGRRKIDKSKTVN